MSEKIYCGTGKKHPDYEIVNVALCLSDLPKEHIFEYKDKKYIKLKVVEKKEPDKFGKTHYVEVDTWRPEPKEEPKQYEPKEPESKEEIDNLPF